MKITRIFANKFIRAMKTKLTLTMEAEVISTAKNHAQKKGKSLSRIVENYLKSISSQELIKPYISPKISKLMGVIALPTDFDYKKEIRKEISKKHQK